MKQEKFIDAITNLDADILDRYFMMKNDLQTKKSSKSRILIRWTALAACLALIISAMIVAPMLQKESTDKTPHLTTQDPGNENIPPINKVHYTAYDIAAFFNGRLAEGATNAYTKVYVSDSKYLLIDELPSAEYLSAYSYGSGLKLSEAELQKFIDKNLVPLAASAGISIPEYKIEKGDRSGNSYLSVYISGTEYKYYVIAEQNQTQSVISIDMPNKFGNHINLDGEDIQIDQRNSDEDIISSIESAKNKLFEIFGRSFSDVKVVRSFNSYSDHGATNVGIIFYDKDAHPLNLTQRIPVSDYIYVSFDNFANTSDEIESDDILFATSIRYYESRIDVSKIEGTKGISLEEAENLLYSGYVFGGHACPLCMENQEKVSFEDYDFVDIEYVFEYSEDESATIGIPFYAFYKKIGTENANEIYAKTYVAAIEVSGYEEYFESQKNLHNQN